MFGKHVIADSITIAFSCIVITRLLLTTTTTNIFGPLVPFGVLVGFAIAVKKIIVLNLSGDRRK